VTRPCPCGEAAKQQSLPRLGYVSDAHDTSTHAAFIFLKIIKMLAVIFVLLRIILYLVILNIDILDRLDFRGGGPPAGVLQTQHQKSFELSFKM
jgi:hypothetical protein